MSLKVILMDIDGTLANSKKEISEETAIALRKVQDSGVRLVLASGRPTNGLVDFGHQLEMDKHGGIFISYNGGEVSNFETGEVLMSQAMSVEEGKALLEHLKKFDVVPMLSHGKYMYVNDVFNNYIQYKGEPFNVMKYEARGNKFMLCEMEDLAAFCDFGIIKLLTYGEPSYLQEHYKEMAAPFEGILNSMFTADFYYEFTAKGIDKANAIEKTMLSMGYKPEEMIAFGDAENDATMIQYAGVGVAMANAKDSLKEVADYITASNDEDGIAKALYHYFPEIFK